MAVVMPEVYHRRRSRTTFMTTSITDPTPRTPRLAALLIAGLLLSFLLQYKTSRVADWALFSFYDPGTTIKGEYLLRQGLIPTIDFGYTHGLLALAYGRLGFAALGLTPHAFLALTLLTEFVMAFALARIFTALQLRWPSIVLFLAAIPIAIMPCYLTLAHPLEAMLILLALADQAEDKHPRALAILTACLFVKPSMAYVYGFLLLLLILHRHWPKHRPILRAILPAAVTLIAVFLALTLWLGPRPVISTLIPITGAATYSKTGFGFFAESGRALWYHRPLWEYLITPVSIFLLATLAATVGAVYALSKIIRRPDNPRLQLLFTLGALHTTFLLGFYGWTGSWTYYSYLPILALCILVEILPLKNQRWTVASVLLAGVLAAHGRLAGSAYVDFMWKQPAPVGVYAYSDQLTEFNQLLAATDNRPTLIMSVGWLTHLPPNVRLPEAWFPEPGIPTASEIQRVKTQAQHADYILLWNEYRQLDLWNSPDFTDVRAQFEQEQGGHYLTLLRRRR
jgi:hypothetical protein